MRKKITIVVLILAFILAVTHAVAISFHLYFYFWWLDIPMHFLAGIVLTAIILVLYYRLGFARWFGDRTNKIWLIALSGMFFVGMAWEYFEYVHGITFNTIGSYQMDTIKDLFMDELGAVFTCAFYLYLKERILSNK